MFPLIKSTKLPRVAIIGRTNVGKSTLFNRLVEKQAALISNQAGTTRDRRYGQVVWRGKKFEIIDTGGLEVLDKKLSAKRQSKNEIIKAVHRQIDQALKEAEAIIFLVDAKDGPLPPDKQLVLNLRKIKKPFLLVVNKIDNQKFAPGINEFYSLACGQPLAISATNGSGVGDMLDKLTKLLPKLPTAGQKIKEEKLPLKLALVGKPNVGKSSLVNAILGEERVIVSQTPHTTREPQNALIKYRGKEFLLIDMAGIRKKNKITKGLESKGVDKSIAAINKAEVAVLIVEAHEPLGSQEKHLTSVIEEAGCGVIIAANKWDLIEDKESNTTKEFKNYFYGHFPYLTFAPIIFVSAKTGQRVKKILDLAQEIQIARQKFIEEKTLNKFLKKTVKQHQPKRARGSKHPYIYNLKQTGIKPPTFVLTIDKKAPLHSSYLRFLANRLREKFDFPGTPIKIISREIK